jgi:hypothetical protein
MMAAKLDLPLEALIDKVQTARSLKAPLQIRGGGTKDFYGEAPKGEPLDTTALAGISDYTPSELVVSVRAPAGDSACPSSRRASPPAARWAAWWRRAWPARRGPPWGASATTCWAPRSSTAVPRC